MQEKKYHIKIPLKYWTYLIESADLPQDLCIKLSESVLLNPQHSRVTVVLTSDEAEKIREWCAEQLQIKGFGHQYEHTQSGRILEDLIDYFFIE